VFPNDLPLNPVIHLNRNEGGWNIFQAASQLKYYISKRTIPMSVFHSCAEK